MVQGSKPSIVRQVIPAILIVAGLVELVMTVRIVMANQSSWQLAALNLPSSFLPITLAVVFAALAAPNKWLRGTVAITAVAFAGVRLGLIGALMAADDTPRDWIVGIIPGTQSSQVSLGISVVTGTVLGLGLAVWACMDFLNPRVAHVASRPVEVDDDTPDRTIRQRTNPAQPSPQIEWTTASTPWAGSDENEGSTIIRPRS